MEFEELISAGWRDHEKDTATVAASLEEHHELVTDGKQATQLAALANHAIGEHLGDWRRAAGLVGKVVGRLTPGPDLVAPLGFLAVGRFLAGDAAAAVATETEAAALAGDDGLVAVARTRMLLAAGLIAAKRAEEGYALYRAALALVDRLPEGTPADRAVAITSNNLASGLLEKPERSEGETELMIRAAEAARTYWVRAGTWENDERADYLLALVMNAAGRPAEGLGFAERGLATIRENGEEPVDEAFLRLAAAGAHGKLGDEAAHARELAAAEALAAEFPSDGLKNWFESEAAKVR